MKLRVATQEDLNAVMAIIIQAQQFLKRQGIDQWQNNYPNIETMRKDILDRVLYVLADATDIYAVAAIIMDTEPTYARIEDGAWLNENPYCVIHRLAVASRHQKRGIASKLIRGIETLCIREGILNLRIDTHRDNGIMRRLLERNGFCCCGVIYLASGEQRLAYQKSLTSDQI